VRWLPPRLAAALPVARHRDFRLLFAGQSISLIGDALFPVALAFAVIGVGGEERELGFVLAAQALPLAALVVPAGWVGDHFPRRAVMLASAVVRAGADAALAVLLLTETADVGHLAALAALYGAAEAFFYPAESAFVAEVVPRESLQQARALLNLAHSAGYVVGPALAGVLIALGGVGVAFAVDAASFAAVVTCLALVHTRQAPGAEEGDEPVGFLRGLREGARAVSSRPWLRTFLGVMGAYHLLALPALFGLGPLLAERELGGAAAWGAISAAFGVGAFAGNAIALRIDPGRPVAFAALCFCGAACQPAIIASGLPLGLLVAVEAVAGTAVALGFTTWEATLARQVPGRVLARVTSYDFLTSAAVMPVGYALAGPMAAWVGLQTAMIAASVLAAAAAASALAVRDVRAVGA
jgi:MFS family permease